MGELGRGCPPCPPPLARSLVFKLRDCLGFKVGQQPRDGNMDDTGAALVGVGRQVGMQELTKQATCRGGGRE